VTIPPVARNGPGFIATVRYDGDGAEASYETVECIGVQRNRTILPVRPVPSNRWKARNSTGTLIRDSGPLTLHDDGRTR
jgi:hypothetical protein